MDRRFGRDVFWNLASIGVLGVSGVALNVIIGRWYGTAVFGVFSQVLSVYYILSQLSVGGFIFSALKYTADHADDKAEVGGIIFSAALITATFASAVCALTWAGSGLIGSFFGSDGVARGILWMLPGLWCFAVNKVLLFSLNGLRHMRFFALGNALRFVLILLVLILLSIARVDSGMLPVCISAGEVVLLPVLLFYLAYNGFLHFGKTWKKWIRPHLDFGLRSFFTGLLMDMNFTTDIVILGYFADDRTVGVYSFAAMFAGGMYQFIFAVQSNMNPILSRLKIEGRESEVRGLVRKNALWFCPAMAAMSTVGVLFFPWVTLWVTGNAELASGWPYLAILTAGVTIASSYLPFGYLLNQWGHPVWFMVYSGLLLGTNVLLNILLVPLWGGVGSAVATAMAFMLAIVYLKTLTRYVTGTSI